VFLVHGGKRRLCGQLVLPDAPAGAAVERAHEKRNLATAA
jgi:hypothetical protein